MYEVDDLAEAERVLASLEVDGVLLVDLENTLMPSGGQVEACAPSIRSHVARLRGIPGVAEVLIVTNRRLRDHESRTLAIPTVSDAGKPRRLRHVPRGSVAAVVGDQFLTDGLLARAYGVPFVRIRTPLKTLPIPSRVPQVLLGLVMRAGLLPRGTSS